jgi:hypothetical protein
MARVAYQARPSAPTIQRASSMSLNLSSTSGSRPSAMASSAAWVAAPIPTQRAIRGNSPTRLPSRKLPRPRGAAASTTFIIANGTPGAILASATNLHPDRRHSSWNAHSRGERRTRRCTAGRTTRHIASNARRHAARYETIASTTPGTPKSAPASPAIAFAGRSASASASVVTPAKSGTAHAPALSKSLTMSCTNHTPTTLITAGIPAA